MSTLASIRRSIGARTGQPFFRRMGAPFGTATGGSTTTLVDTSFLHQEDNFWKGQFVYIVNQQRGRVISASSQTAKSLTWIEPTTAVTSGTQYEIWSQFSVAEVHAAINAALRDAWPFFFTQNTGYLVVLEDVVEYNLSTLSPLPRWTASVLVESPESYAMGRNTAAPGSQRRLRDDNRTFTTEDIGKTVRIYAGTSAGDIRTVTAIISANVIEVNANFTATLTTSSKYLLASAKDPTWYMSRSWDVDRQDNPTTLRFYAPLSGLEGRRLRLMYEAEFPELVAETDSTTCPLEYLESAALARLYLTKMASAPPSEARNWAVLQRAHAEAAQMFAVKSPFRHLESTWLQQVQVRGWAHDSPF